MFCLLLVGLSAEAQKKKKNFKVAIEVDGVCMMCKKRIEKAALNSKGVKFATWDVKTHLLSLIIDENKTEPVITSSLKRNKVLRSRLTEEDQINHKKFIETLKVNPVWYNES